MIPDPVNAIALAALYYFRASCKAVIVKDRWACLDGKFCPILCALKLFCCMCRYNNNPTFSNFAAIYVFTFLKKTVKKFQI